MTYMDGLDPRARRPTASDPSRSVVSACVNRQRRGAVNETHRPHGPGIRPRARCSGSLSFGLARQSGDVCGLGPGQCGSRMGSQASATGTTGSIFRDRHFAAVGGGDVSGICVDALHPRMGTLTLVGSATTAADGTYAISGLSAGNYDVEFSVAGCGTTGSYLTQWYNNAASSSTAHVVAGHRRGPPQPRLTPPSSPAPLRGR